MQASHILESIFKKTKQNKTDTQTSSQIQNFSVSNNALNSTHSVEISQALFPYSLWFRDLLNPSSMAPLHCVQISILFFYHIAP